MNKNFDESTMKNASIIMAMLLIFTLIVGKAYDFIEAPKSKEIKPLVLPARIEEPLSNNAEYDSSETSDVITDENSYQDEEQKCLEDEISSDDKSVPKKLEVDLSGDVDASIQIEPFDLPDTKNIPILQEQKDDLELINETLSTIEPLKPLDPFVNKRFQLAEQNSKNKNYVQAIKIYNDIAQDIDASDSIKARCYDNIAKIYVLDKKYGLAAKYANMANEAENTQERSDFVSKFKYNKSSSGN